MNEKHGADHGVNLGDPRVLAEWLRTQQELARQLWATDVVRLTMYTTGVDVFMHALESVGPRMAEAGVPLGVRRLAFPELMIELEATAVG